MRFGLAVVLVAAIYAFAVGVVAVIDHRHTREEIGKANVAGWYCKTRGQRCDQPQPDRIHDRWEKRELTYRAAGGFVAVIFVVAVYRLARQRNLR